MAATLLFRSKFVYPDGAIREMVLWKLPVPDAEYPRGLKYGLHYGYPSRQALVRYDNERGKGDHRHTEDGEVPYMFTDVETLVADFLSDIDQMRGEKS